MSGSQSESERGSESDSGNERESGGESESVVDVEGLLCESSGRGRRMAPVGVRRSWTSEDSCGCPPVVDWTSRSWTGRRRTPAGVLWTWKSKVVFLHLLGFDYFSYGFIGIRGG